MNILILELIGLLFKSYVKNYLATYFDSFVLEHIRKEIKRFIDNKIIDANIYGTQSFNSIILLVLLYVIY